MKHLKQIIQNTGCSDSEAKAYLASLELGEATVVDIANKAGIPRTTCQHVILQLRQRGLMSYYVKQRRKYWVAENPQKILLRLEEQETLLRNAMPRLQTIQHTVAACSTLRPFCGEKETRQIFDDIIETKHHILSLAAVDVLHDIFGDVFTNFVSRRFTRHLNDSLLTNRSPLSEQFRKNDAKELRQTRFLPSALEIKSATFIYGDKTAIFFLCKTKPAGIIIQNHEFSETQKNLFSYLWEKSSS
jgi:sugar-specific transcriptional regulator TrmB